MAISGKLAKINGVSTAGKFSIVESSDLPPAVAASNTAGGEASIPGNLDWKGTYEAYGQVPTVFPGQAFSFAGTVDGTNGCSGTAIVDQVEIEYDLEKNAPVKHTVQFSGNGALTKGPQAATDVSTINIDPARQYVPELDGTPINNVRSVRITFKCDNQSYVDSSTNGLVKRVGGNLSGSVAIAVNVSTLATLPALNTYKILTIGDWEIKYILLKGLDGIEVNIETAAIVGATINADFSAVDDNNTLGSITAGTNTLWPAT